MSRCLQCMAVLALFTLPSILFGQSVSSSTGSLTNMTNEMTVDSPLTTRKAIAIRVLTLHDHAVPGARVEVTSNSQSDAHILNTDKQGDIQTEYNIFEQEAAKNFIAYALISKKGFLPARRILDLRDSVHELSTVVSLRPVQPEDSSMLSHSVLMETLGARLSTVSAADGLSPKQAKDYARAVQDFSAHDHPDHAVQLLDKVVNLNPNCLKCRTMLALAELKWDDWDDSHLELEKVIRAIQADTKLGFAEPYLIYGELRSWNNDPAKSIPFLTYAAKFSPNDAFTLQELGRADCQNMYFYDASVALKKALDVGAGDDARLFYAQSLAWTGRPDNADLQLQKYLNGRDPKSMPPRIREMVDQIKSGKRNEQILSMAKQRAVAKGQPPIDYLKNPPKIAPDFEPATDQAGLAAILDATGKNVAAMFDGLPNICSTEEVYQQRLNSSGKTTNSQNYKYRYLLTQMDRKFGPSFDEFRADLKGHETSEQGLSENAMLTLGFVSAPLVFHTIYQPASTFKLLGKQKVNGRSAYVLVYAQSPERSNISGTFVYGNVLMPTYTQGLAWIDAENYEIVRLTSELLNPVPQVRLDKERTEIDFQAVKFKQSPQLFWLPDAVSVTLGWNGRTFRNNHLYSDFLLSNVDSSQKIAKPKDADKLVEQVSERAPNNSSSPVPGNSANSSEKQ